jgi:hypothetical protein
MIGRSTAKRTASAATIANAALIGRIPAARATSATTMLAYEQSEHVDAAPED